MGCCMQRKLKDLVGTKINGIQIVNYSSLNRRRYFDCICFCGTKFSIRADALKEDGTQSCGCMKGDLISSKNRLPDNLGSLNLVYRHYKQNAKKRSLEYRLSIDDFKKLISGNCFYCGYEPTLSKFVSSSPNRRDRELVCNGIDRVNSEHGYSSDNCVSCCSICNRAKSDLSVEEFQNWIEKIVRLNAK